MKTVKKKTVRQGTRRMINAQAVTPYGLLTYRGGETAFFLLRPTCISVLPEDALAARVGALVTVFKSQPELEILCLNSRESFANNTRYLEARIGEEENPYIADLLEKDKAHLGSVQLQTATAREFVLAVRLEAVREKEKYPYLARVEKLIRDQGFDVRRADLDDVKRLMAVYFVQDFTSEHYGQLERNYGKEGCSIILDNAQDTIAGGFSPAGDTAEQVSRQLGEQTVMTGSVSRGKSDPSRSLQMMGRRLMTPDELKSMPKGQFIVMKTGRRPMLSKLRLFLDWGITFTEPYALEQHAQREVKYAGSKELRRKILKEYGIPPGQQIVPGQERFPERQKPGMIQENV